MYDIDIIPLLLDKLGVTIDQTGWDHVKHDIAQHLRAQNKVVVAIDASSGSDGEDNTLPAPIVAVLAEAGRAGLRRRLPAAAALAAALALVPRSGCVLWPLHHRDGAAPGI